MNADRQPWTIPAGRTIADRGVMIGVWSVAAMVSAAFLWVVGDLVGQGAHHVDWQFLTSEPSKAGRAGGIFPIIVSTLSILVVAMSASVPIAIGTALGLAEFIRRGSFFSAMVGRSLDMLAAVPSIVFGLFGNAFFCQMLGLGYSILAGGLTLACMVLPMLTRSLEVALRAVPDDYRLAAAALGMSKTRTAAAVLLPAAVPGLVVGLVLGVGRTLAETAALLFTSGYADRMPRSIFDSGRSLSIHVYDLAMNVPGGEPNAYASALVLVGLLIIINALAVGLSDRWLQRRGIAR